MEFVVGSTTGIASEVVAVVLFGLLFGVVGFCVAFGSVAVVFLFVFVSLLTVTSVAVSSGSCFFVAFVFYGLSSDFLLLEVLKEKYSSVVKVAIVGF